MTLWSDRLKGQTNQETRYRFDKIFAPSVLICICTNGKTQEKRRSLGDVCKINEPDSKMRFGKTVSDIYIIHNRHKRLFILIYNA